MIPLIPTLCLAFFSFICSAFIILRIILPILPPHPLSKRVSPAEFGLPKFRSLSPADKTHLWLAGLDLLTLSVFVWQAVNEALGGPTDFKNAGDPASSVRLWFALTVRQTCFLIVIAITLLHVRIGRSISFGTKHWMIWSPTLLLTITSTCMTGVMSGAGLDSLFIGLMAYTSAIAVLSAVALGCVVGTLIIIKRNLAALNEEADPWPPVRVMEEKPRPSFATEDIDALRDSSSWITSNASSRRESISAWSFSTHHTSHHGHGSGRLQKSSQNSVLPKSSFWFGAPANDADVPPVPPLPSPYGPMSPTADTLRDPDPFRRDTPSPSPNFPRERLGSQTSWLTSTNGSHATMSSWSYPTTHREGSIAASSHHDIHTALTAVSRPATPAMASAQVLGGYGYRPGTNEAEKGLASLAAPPGTDINISQTGSIGWYALICFPLALTYPYLILAAQNANVPVFASVLLVLSVTSSSPILALNILFKHPLPIPTGLFDIRGDNSDKAVATNDPPYTWSHEYKRSMSTSVTVVEGRRSGDVWLSNGDAIDGKGKMGRAVTMLVRTPKLSVLPPEEKIEDGELTPPLPIQNEDSSLPVSIHNTPHSENSAQFGRLRKDSKASSRISGGDENLAFASRIMIAQRHYSAIAQTVMVPGSSPEKNIAQVLGDIYSAASGVTAQPVRTSTHLRVRSVSSISGPQTPTTGDSFNISPPPSLPLPPTPPNVRAARLASLAHKKSFSSGFSFGPVDNMNEIDALTAGVLPLLVPGIDMGAMKIKEGDWTPPGTFGKADSRKLAKKLNEQLDEFGANFSSPEVHSTPARKRLRETRSRKESYKRHHFSLPSLGLGKDGVHSLAAWSVDVRGAIENHVTATPRHIDSGRRNTVFGADAFPNTHAVPLATIVDGEAHTEGANLGRAFSTRSLGLRADVPHSVGTARSSMVSSNIVPPTSAASTATLFEEFEAELLASSPQAESTPHNNAGNYKVSSKPPPPLPQEMRRSSIVYIKSDDHETNTTPPNQPSNTSQKSTLAEWSARAVRPLIPKASKLQRKMSNAASSLTGAKSGAAGGGLRPLTLLQDRDLNTVQPAGGANGTRPLTLGKKQKSRAAAAPVQDENARPDSVPGNKNLKPLKLARSETSKMRGILRKQEVLPDVVVRPPSTTDHAGFVYSFRD